MDNFKVYISIITLYEFLFGKKYISEDIIETKSAIERVFAIIPLTQEILEKCWRLMSRSRSVAKNWSLGI